MAEREAAPLWPPIEPPLTAPGWLGQAMELVDRLTQNAYQRGLDGDHDPHGRQQGDLREHLRLHIMQRAGAALKDHVLREAVNDVTKVAREFHGTQQLRERLLRAMEPIIAAARGTPTGDRPTRERAKSVKFKCQYGPQDEGNAEYDSWLPGRAQPESAGLRSRELPIPVARFAPSCETCHGTGQNPEWPLAICPNCEGTGKTLARR